MRPRILTSLLLGVLLAAGATGAAEHDATRRNVIIFVADGLRPGSVNPVDAPTLLGMRQRGVYFANSHALFPTFTTANASAIASGHQLGDTGDFSNALYPGFPLFDGTPAATALGKSPATVTPFLENNQVLVDLDEHFESGNFLGETTLLGAARLAGYRTAAIGKLGPVAIQDLAQLQWSGQGFSVPQTVIIDDNTGRPDGAGKPQSPPLPDDVVKALAAAGLGVVTPARAQPAGNLNTPGTHDANGQQQHYFADAATRAVLPVFRASGRPFVLLFWSRDPDGSQHNQGDSLNRLDPGINGPTSRAGVAEADANLRQILDFVDADPALAATTDIFVTSDHGFATISKHETDPGQGVAASFATSVSYRGADGQPEVRPGWLPPGFLAIDLAHLLGLPLFDPDSQSKPGFYRAVDPAGGVAGALQRPSGGNGVIGGSGDLRKLAAEAKLIVAANGGADLLYLPDGDRKVLGRVVAFLLRQDYVGGLFVHSRHGSVAGTLPLAAIGLEGSAGFPAPDIVVAFRSFARDRSDPVQTSVQVSDTGLQEGQGMHGGFARACTLNNMIALGPDFKAGLVDTLPVGNADIVPTIARLLGLSWPARGQLQGRVLEEALLDGAGEPAVARSDRLVSVDPLSGRATVLEFQQLGEQRYLDQACLLEMDEEQQAPESLRCP